ncbi:MAG: hypothetical protein ACI4OI_01650, partial [Gemmiger sp.]
YHPCLKGVSPAMTYVGGLVVLALVGVFCLALSARIGVDAALLPLPVLSAASVVLLAAGCVNRLPWGLWLCYALLAAGTCLILVRHGAGVLRRALPSPGFWLFLGAGALFWVIFAVQQPLFTQWDEFTAWGLAPKMVKEMNALYAAEPVNLTAYHTYPGTSLVSYFFQGLSPRFTEWQCLAALDILLMACLAAATALPPGRWPHSILIFAVGALLPYFFSTLPAGTPSVAYANAMADLPMGMLFGGVLCLYFGGREQGRWLALPALALLTMTKDITFAYGLIAVFVMLVDRLLAVPRQWPRSLGNAVVLAAPVLGVFLLWGRYTAAVDPASAPASVGSEGLSYGAVLTGGIRQLLGIGREEKFSRLMALMGQAFFSRRLCLLGSGAVAVALITAVAGAAWLCAEKGARRRVAGVWAALAFCFAALYVFHLILYHYNFAEEEALALKDYDRYLSPYYMGWLLTMLCLLGQGLRRRLSGAALAGGTVALVAVFFWRGVPCAGFWTNADSLYTLRADVKRRAAAANEVLDWEDRVLVLSQGDDATRWYYYKYELTAHVVNGYGGLYWGGEDTTHRWDSDFMNLVESLNWELYDFQAVGNANSVADYMAEKGCDYLLIDRADAYLEREFSYRFEGGLTAGMPATLYRFTGAENTVAFVPVAVAESGVQP